MTLPDHGIERYEHYRCRCEVCTAAHVRVERLAEQLEDAYDERRYPRGVVAPLDSVHAAELDAMDARDWAEVRRGR